MNKPVQVYEGQGVPPMAHLESLMKQHWTVKNYDAKDAIDSIVGARDVDLTGPSAETSNSIQHLKNWIENTQKDMMAPIPIEVTINGFGATIQGIFYIMEIKDFYDEDQGEMTWCLRWYENWPVGSKKPVPRFLDSYKP